MKLSYASNAVLSKARAMYGKKLSEKNYNDLLTCRTISDIVNYLKRKTTYREVLDNINEHHVHRSELESALKSRLIVDFGVLARYDISVGEHFYEYLISRVEVEQIMHSLIFMTAGKEIKFNLPEFFYEHTKIDLKNLNKIKNYSDFLKIIKKSDYYKILKEFENNIDITIIETELHNYSHKIIFKTIDKYLCKKAKLELKKFFSLYIDLSNLVRIVRMKKFYNLSYEYMSKILLDGGNLTREKLNMFINSEDNKQMMNDMKSISIGKKWFSRDLDIVDKVPVNMKFNWCKHNIRFSTHSAIVLISYIFLKEIEILNLITIIEGVKYKLSPDEIKKMLIK
ncbi:MAG: V-type ATPase subunit [Clostridia bacterium]|nr:V-type ATPase subunit [Clostridia bacterium]MBQ3093241.1 V-type ATPase subunit [Clostridia bacterium]